MRKVLLVVEMRGSTLTLTHKWFLPVESMPLDPYGVCNDPLRIIIVVTFELSHCVLASAPFAPVGFKIICVEAFVITSESGIWPLHAIKCHTIVSVFSAPPF